MRRRSTACSSRALPVASALLAAALFGATTPASKHLLAGLPALPLASLLYLGAALATAPAALRSERLWPRDPRGTGFLLGAIALGGALAPVLMLAGLALASSASVALWLELELFATALFGALFFRDRLGRAGWLGCAGALAAGALLSRADAEAGGLAGALVAAACCCWALDNHWTALVDGVPASVTTFWKGAVAGGANAALAAALGLWRSEPAAIAAALAVGGAGYGLSHVLSLRAAQDLGATRAQILFSSAPVFGLAGAWLALGEPVLRAQLAGAGLLAVSLLLLFRERHAHFHRHRALAHVHPHTHDDGHHRHAHPGQPDSLQHSHWHTHEALAHDHPHLPDLHHRHRHGEAHD